jgi:pSer/pThr/pTyr-binding forkhead associated (FHA) protein
MSIMVFLYSGSLKGRSIEINKGEVSIGRGADNDIRLVDLSVSKKHAKLFKTPKGCAIEDLGSQNGTWIDGNPIERGKKVRIESGIPISIGDVLLSIGKPLPDGSLSMKTSIDPPGPRLELASTSVQNDTLMTNRRKLHQIFEISKSLTQSLDIKEVHEKILDSLFLHFKKLEAGVILLLDEISGSLNQVVSKVRDNHKNNRLYISRSIVKQAMEKSKAVMITDTS